MSAPRPPHPMWYGYDYGQLIQGTDLAEPSRRGLREWYRRCYICQEWSPCRVNQRALSQPPEGR